jgi:prophage regulatory protein
MNNLAARQSTPGRFLKIGDVTRETSLHRATIYRRVARGEFPAPQPIGGGRVAWRESDIETWKEHPEDYTPT